MPVSAPGPASVDCGLLVEGRVGLLIAVVAWFGAYLIVIGPVVRWQAGTSEGWWSVAGGVMALPFLVAAWREWRRT